MIQKAACRGINTDNTNSIEPLWSIASDENEKEEKRKNDGPGIANLVKFLCTATSHHTANANSNESL
jgi:hypothetical protein